jgi:hypothetical protein
MEKLNYLDGSWSHWRYRLPPSGRPARVRGCCLRVRSTAGLRGPPEAASDPRHYRAATAARTLVSGFAIKGNPYQNTGRRATRNG